MGLNKIDRSRTIISKILYFILLILVLIFLEDFMEMLGLEVGEAGLVIIRLLIMTLFLIFIVYRLKSRITSEGADIMFDFSEESFEQTENTFAEDRVRDKEDTYGEGHFEMRKLDARFSRGEITEDEYREELKKIKEKHGD